MPPTEMLGLECADCGFIATSIEQAEAHELEQTDDLHGGWDTVRFEVKP